MEWEEGGLNKFNTDVIDFTETYVLASGETPVSDNPKCQANVVVHVMVTAETYITPCFKCNIHAKSQFQETYPVLPIEKFQSVVLPTNAIKAQQFITQFPFYFSV